MGALEGRNFAELVVSIAQSLDTRRGSHGRVEPRSVPKNGGDG